MVSIVAQFRAFKNVQPICNMYTAAGQKLAAKMVRECEHVDDKALLERLREYSSVFINSMQTVEKDTGLEWREFLRELANDVVESCIKRINRLPIFNWSDSAWLAITLDRIGFNPSFDEIKRLIMTDDELPVSLNGFKNIVEVGKKLPDITRELIKSNNLSHYIVQWLSLVEIYTRRYQGRVMYKQPEYDRLVKQLTQYGNAHVDLSLIRNAPMDIGYHKAYVIYFLKRIVAKDFHLAASFLCDNIGVFDDFDRSRGRDRLSGNFCKALGLAAMVFKEEKEMNSKIQQTAKPRKIGDLLRKCPTFSDCVIENDIRELEANIKQIREQMAQMRDATAKLRATINKSKKLIADWEC